MVVDVSNRRHRMASSLNWKNSISWFSKWVLVVLVARLRDLIVNISLCSCFSLCFYFIFSSLLPFEDSLLSLLLLCLGMRFGISALRGTRDSSSIDEDSSSDSSDSSD